MRGFTLAAAVWLAAAGATAQEVTRTELTRAPVPGSDMTEVITFRVSVPPRAWNSLHTRPGAEHAVVLQGGLIIPADGSETAMPDGIFFHFPEGMVHGGLSAAGDVPLELVTVYVVRAGEPATVLAV